MESSNQLTSGTQHSEPEDTSFAVVAIEQRIDQLSSTCKAAIHLVKAFSLSLHSQHKRLMTI